MITGPCGVGKTWLACALGQRACRDNLTVIYQRLPRLFADLELAHGDGRFARMFRSLVKADLLILDDWGPDRLTAGQRRDLMEIVEDRHGRGSILITSQLPLTAWHDVIDEATFADAILDRLVHNAYRLELDGHSMRRSTDTNEKVDEASRPDIKKPCLDGNDPQVTGNPGMTDRMLSEQPTGCVGMRTILRLGNPLSERGCNWLVKVSLNAYEGILDLCHRS